MTEKELRKLNRRQLLELMLEQSKRIDKLEYALVKAQEELNNRRITIQESGNIAEAALRLNNIFEAAQQAADQYVESIRAKEKRAAANYLASLRRDETGAEND